MKKLLAILAAMQVTTLATSSIVACSSLPDTNVSDSENDVESEKEGIHIGEIENIFPETILSAYQAKVSDADISNLEVFDYNQTSARLIQRRTTIASASFQPIRVEFTIKALDISENNQELITNIIAGNMDELGVIDQSTRIRDIMQNQQVTKKSIRTSFALMNGIYIKDEDIQINNIEYNGIIGTVEIKSKNQDVLKGEESLFLTINNNVDTTNLLRVTDVGRIYLPSSIYNVKHNFYDGANNASEVRNQMMSAYTYVFQNIGDRNPIFAYLATDLSLSAITIISRARSNVEENIGMDFLNINLAWRGTLGLNTLLNGGIISSNSMTARIEFELAEEDRVFFGDHRAVDELEVSKTAYSSRNRNQIIWEIYEQMDEEFKTKIPLDVLDRFSKIHFVGADEIPTIEILPGGDFLYGLDYSAWILLSSELSEEERATLRPISEGTNPGFKFNVV